MQCMPLFLSSCYVLKSQLLETLATFPKFSFSSPSSLQQLFQCTTYSGHSCDSRKKSKRILLELKKHLEAVVLKVDFCRADTCFTEKSVILAMASLRPSTVSHTQQNRRSNSRHRTNHSAFATREGQKQRASNASRTSKASFHHSQTQSHVHGSCEPASKDKKNAAEAEQKKQECVKLVTYPIMQV